MRHRFDLHHQRHLLSGFCKIFTAVFYFIYSFSFVCYILICIMINIQKCSWCYLTEDIKQSKYFLFFYKQRYLESNFKRYCKDIVHCLLFYAILLVVTVYIMIVCHVHLFSMCLFQYLFSMCVRAYVYKQFFDTT